MQQIKSAVSSLKVFSENSLNKTKTGVIQLNHFHSQFLAFVKKLSIAIHNSIMKVSNEIRKFIEKLLLRKTFEKRTNINLNGDQVISNQLTLLNQWPILGQILHRQFLYGSVRVFILSQRSRFSIRDSEFVFGLCCGVWP